MPWKGHALIYGLNEYWSSQWGVGGCLNQICMIDSQMSERLNLGKFMLQSNTSTSFGKNKRMYKRG